MGVSVHLCIYNADNDDKRNNDDNDGVLCLAELLPLYFLQPNRSENFAPDSIHCRQWAII